MDSYDPEKLVKIKAIILNSFENRRPLNVSRQRDTEEFELFQVACSELEISLAPKLGKDGFQEFQKYCFIEGLYF